MNVVTALLMSKKKIIKLFEVSKAFSADTYHHQRGVKDYEQTDTGYDNEIQ